MARGDDITADFGEGWRAGAEAMRAFLLAEAQHHLHDTHVLTSMPPQCAGVFAFIQRAKALPIPAPPPQPDGLSYRGG